jgi:hypothetical protein
MYFMEQASLLLEQHLGDDQSHQEEGHPPQESTSQKIEAVAAETENAHSSFSSKARHAQRPVQHEGGAALDNGEWGEVTQRRRS